MHAGFAQIGISANGSSADASAMLDVASSDKGMLIPRMSSTDRENISNPATGLMVFDLTTNSFWFYNSGWMEINTDKQTIDVLSLSGDNLQLSLENDGQNTQTLDLSNFKDNTDDQTIDVFSLSGNNLQLSLEGDGQSTQTLDLGSFKDNTDDQTIDVFSLAGNNLQLSLEGDGQSIQTLDLSSFKDNTDDQTIDVFSLSGNNLQLSLEGDGQDDKTLDLGSFKQTLNLSNDELSISNGNSIALNSAFLRSNGVTYSTSTSDDFLFGASTMNHGSGSEMKIIFDRSKGAFRAGTVTGDAWDASKLGIYSTALGRDSEASSAYSVAIGEKAKALDSYAVSIGNSNTADGLSAFALGNANSVEGDIAGAVGGSNDINDRYSYAIGHDNEINEEFSAALGTENVVDGRRSTAIGYRTEAESYGETAIGIFNTRYTPESRIIYEGSDRLFVIGNGLNNNDRRDALVMNKEGRSQFNGDASGPNEYVMTIDNTQYNNSQPNNGLLIRAGHSSYNSGAQSTFIRFFRPDGGNCGRIRQDGGSAGKLVDSSDERLKENIRPTRYGLKDVLNIEVKDYNFITDDDDFVKTGFIAQQLYTVYPTAVTVGDDVKTNPWGVTYSDLTPLLVQGMQDQHELIEQQRQEIEQLQTKLDEMQKALTTVSQLEAQYAELKTLVQQMQVQINQ